MKTLSKMVNFQKLKDFYILNRNSWDYILNYVLRASNLSTFRTHDPAVYYPETMTSGFKPDRRAAALVHCATRDLAICFTNKLHLKYFIMGCSTSRWPLHRGPTEMSMTTNETITCHMLAGLVLVCSDAQNVQWWTKMCSDERLFVQWWIKKK